MTDNPTVVLVHGAWHNDSSWDLVREQLDQRGIRSVAVQLPMSATLELDAATVREAIEAVDGDVVVVGHSWGGSPMTLGAAGLDRVKYLIYLTAFMLEAGVPVTDFEGRHETEGSSAMVIEGDNAIIDPARAYDSFYNDVDHELAEATTRALRPFALAGFAHIDTELVAPWKTVPSTYVVCTEDHAIHPEDQRSMAANAGEVIEIATSHSPFLSQPALVADIIAERVQRVVG